MVLEKHPLPKKTIGFINSETQALNKLHQERISTKLVNKAYSRVLKHVEKEMKLVPKNHYQNLGMLFGMALFGIPLGTTFGINLGNFAFLGMGIPVGMAIGMAVGAGMDAKAKKEGRQIDVDSIF